MSARAFALCSWCSLCALGLALPPASASASDTSERPAANGTSALRERERRSPWGLLVRVPPEPRPMRALPGSDGDEPLIFYAAAELGVLFTSDDDPEPRFDDYRDLDDGFWLRSAAFELLDPKRHWNLDFTGTNLGRDDARAALRLQRPGWLRIDAFSIRTPNRYARDAVTLWDGAGGDELRLAPGLTPAANSLAELQAALVGRPAQSLAVQHDRHGIDLKAELGHGFDASLRYALDRRRGERAFGGGLGFPFFGAFVAAETIEPVDHRNHELAGQLRYAGERLQWNLEAEGQWFRNGDASLTWEQPYDLGFSNLERGRFALSPDSSRVRVGADAAWALPALRANLRAGASWARASQSASLLAPTVNGGATGFAGFNQTFLDPWNQAGSRARSSADATVDLWNAHLRLALRPLRALRLDGRLRFRARDDRTPAYEAFNPLSGEIGYVAEDGAHQAFGGPARVFTPGNPGIDFRYRRPAYDRQHWDARVRGIWSAQRGLQAELGYEHAATRRDDRERRWTRENRIASALRWRRGAWNARASHAWSRRSGSSYQPDPTAAFRVSALPGFVPAGGAATAYTLAQARRPDLAARSRHELNLRVQRGLQDWGDLGWTFQHRDDDYDARFGLRSERAWHTGLDWSVQCNPFTSFGAHAAFEWRERRLRSIDANPVFSSDPNAGGPVFPLANEWRLASEGRAWNAGGRFAVQLHEQLRLETDYTFHEAQDDARLEGATAFPSPDDLATLRTRDHVLSASLRLALDEHVELRALTRYVRSRIDDRSQTGLTPLTGGVLYLGHVDRSYEEVLFGFTGVLRY